MNYGCVKISTKTSPFIYYLADHHKSCFQLLCGPFNVASRQDDNKHLIKNTLRHIKTYIVNYSLRKIVILTDSHHKPHVEGGDDTAVHKHQGQQTNQNPHELMGLRGRR